MKLKLSRESVCAGDDVVAHDRVLIVDDQQTLEQALTTISNHQYLASISGGHASWLALTERDGEMLTVVAQQWDRPRWLVDPARKLSDIGGSIYFDYYAQIDPNEVFDECTVAQRNGVLPPRRSGMILEQSTIKRSAEGLPSPTSPSARRRRWWGRIPSGTKPVRR